MTLVLLLSGSGRVVIWVHHIHSNLRDRPLGAGGKELVDVELTYLPIGGFLHLSLRQDAQVFILGSGT